MTTPDFSLLYARLDLQPDCSLDDLKRAYRRCMQDMHPDRQGIGIAEQGLGVSDLNFIYAQALRFHKQHGRLPGSKPLPYIQGIAPIPVPATSDTHIEEETLQENAPAPPSKGLVLGVVITVLILSALTMKLDYTSTEVDHGSNSIQSPSPRTRESVMHEAKYLQIGMDAAAVLALQGQPINIRDDEWDYGPSWVRFKEGKLVAWYSSPLRQLRVDTRSALTSDEQKQE